ncbi:hypothetical protein [Mycobacteroides abscessus]|uniref:hypothetical protein n=1 Tax=Mycobacteroides abscessus TaxID=36809 RepID=UPI0013F6890C|nr:hypothetical protein [Mycobacteroides abscessus]
MTIADWPGKYGIGFAADQRTRSAAAVAAATVICGLTGDSAWRPNLRRTLEVERA